MTPDSPVVEVSLRDVVESDLPILLEQQLDPVANRMAAVKPRDEKEFMAHWRRNILGDEAVVKKAILCDGQVVGHIASFERAGKREVGYWIGRVYWGKGIASEALVQFLRHDSERPLFAIVAKHNIASIRVLAKCGFAIAGGSRRAEDARGLEVDELTLKLDGHEGP